GRTVSFPMSWNAPPSRSASRRASSQPRSSATTPASAATRAECPCEYGSRASTARASKSKSDTSATSIQDAAALPFPSTSFRDHPPAPQVDDDEDEDRGADDGARADQPVPVERVRGGLAAVEREQADARRPADPAGGVPGDEVELALRREQRRADQRGLARQRDSGRLQHDQREEEAEAIGLDEVLHGGRRQSTRAVAAGRRARVPRGMKVGVPLERAPGERRVALVPDIVSRISQKGFDVLVEGGEGE